MSCHGPGVANDSVRHSLRRVDRGSASMLPTETQDVGTQSPVGEDSSASAANFFDIFSLS